jgi:hypothetical protein
MYGHTIINEGVKLVVDDEAEYEESIQPVIVQPTREQNPRRAIQFVWFALFSQEDDCSP